MIENLGQVQSNESPTKRSSSDEVAKQKKEKYVWLRDVWFILLSFYFFFAVGVAIFVCRVWHCAIWSDFFFFHRFNIVEKFLFEWNFCLSRRKFICLDSTNKLLIFIALNFAHQTTRWPHTFRFFCDFIDERKKKNVSNHY